MSARRAFVLFMGALLVGSFAQADSSSYTPSAGIAGKATGADIYANICQGCHMPEGQGAVGAGFYPKLSGDPALVSWQYVAIVVLGGRHAMPPFGLPADQVGELTTVHLSDAQIADVVNFVRGNLGNKYRDKITAEQIATLPHPGHAPEQPSGPAPRK